MRVTRDQSGTEMRFAVVVPAKIVPLASARNLLRRQTLAALSRITHTAKVSSGIRAVISVRTPHLPEAVVLEQELLSLIKKSGIV